MAAESFDRQKHAAITLHHVKIGLKFGEWLFIEH